jgi:hypothetical protein
MIGGGGRLEEGKVIRAEDCDSRHLLTEVTMVQQKRGLAWDLK